MLLAIFQILHLSVEQPLLLNQLELGNPLLRSFNLCRFISKLEDKDRTRRSSIDDNQPIRSALTGTAYSAAAVGVGARKSEAKSINVVSVS